MRKSALELSFVQNQAWFDRLNMGYEESSKNMIRASLHVWEPPALAAPGNYVRKPLFGDLRWKWTIAGILAFSFVGIWRVKTRFENRCRVLSS